MSEPVTQGAVAALLRLRPGRDALGRWLRAMEAAGVGAPETSTDTPFERLYSTLMAHSRVDPGECLKAVRHARVRLRGQIPRRETAQLVRLEGHALRSVGRCREAAACYRQAYESFRRARDPVEMGRTTIGWVAALALSSEAEEAARVASLGRRHLPRRETVARARLESNLGNAWLLAGQLARATEHYRRALSAFERAERVWEAGGTAYNLGLIHLKRARIEDARRRFDEARKKLGSAGLSVPAAYAAAGLAAADLASGRWDEGIEAIRELREKFAGVSDARAVAQMHRDLATLFVSIGAADAAEPESAAALEAYTRLGLDHDAAQLGLLHGRLLASGGWHQDALTYLEASYAHWKRTGNSWARARAEMEIARLLLAQGHARRARPRLRKAQRVLDRHDRHGDGALCRALGAQAQLEDGHAGLALRLAGRAHEELRGYPARLEKPWVALLVARAHAQAGRSKEAIRWARRSVSELERVLSRFGSRQLRVLVGASRGRIYDGAVDLVLAHGGSRAETIAVDLIAKARSPALIEDLLHGDRAAFQPEVRAAITRLRDEILSGQDDGEDDTRHRALQGEVSRLEARLGMGPRRPPALVRRAWERRGYQQWRPRLGERRLVLYDRGSFGWRAFVIDPAERVRVVELPEAEHALRRAWAPLRITLETAAHADRERRTAFLEKTRAGSLDELETLRRALWEPLSLSPGETVLVPDGALHGVPLEALASLDGDEAWVVSRLPHPALLHVGRSRARDRALLLHGPGGATRREVRSARSVLEAAGYEVELGDRRADLEEESRGLGILHVAAHGSFHREGWLLSGLRLRDGWMGFEQLRRRQVRGALLYFASCESGLSEELPGSDLEGWMSAGLGAGARELVLTLWKVDDRSASGFARGFYPHWSGGEGAARSAAFARRELRARLEHPYHWAPFIAVG